MVWGDTNHAAMSKLFQTFDVEPLNDAGLTAARNARKIKSAMGGSKTWNSLTSEYQLKILLNEDDFKRQGEFDLASIWRHIWDHVKLSTMIGSANLTDKLQTKK